MREHRRSGPKHGMERNLLELGRMFRRLWPETGVGARVRENDDECG
jgi:hypothetical protein